MKKPTHKNQAESVRVDFSKIGKARDSMLLPASRQQHGGAKKKKTKGRHWRIYKHDILEKIDDFSFIYADLKKKLPSGDGWVSALCPFHDDHRPSFGYHTGSGGWICQAGCGEGSVFDYLMKKTGKGFREVLLEMGEKVGIPPPSPNKRSGQVEKAYEYRDEEGTLLFQVVRASGKKFTQRKPNGRGGWIWNLRNVRKVLYHLPDLIARSDERVFVVEGEKDADRLHDEGLLATTNPGGAGKWRQEYSEFLAGRDVIILPDNDATGRHHAVKVASALYGNARTIKILHLPGLQEKGDVSDWLEDGNRISDLKKLVDQADQWSPEKPEPGRPSIRVNNRQQRDIIHDTWSAIHSLNDPPRIYRSAGQLTRLDPGEHGPRVQHMNEAAVYGHLLRVADWVRETEDGITNTKPPREISRDLIVNPDEGLPILEGIITTPIFTADGRLITKPGYHAGSRLWYDKPEDFDLPEIPDSPGKKLVEDSVDLFLDELLGDFPLKSSSDEAHVLAAVLLPFVRRMIDGCTPIHLIESPTPGSGKGLLADLISIIVLGRGCKPTTICRDESEVRKKITALLAKGLPIALIDNVKDQLDSAQLASALTAGTWADRLLGQSVMVEYPNNALWLITANNPRLSMEIARRSVRIRLEPREERPWERKDFKYNPIREWALENRPALVHAALILVQNWLAEGKPHGERVLGSFEHWAKVMGGILKSAGVGGFLKNTKEFYDKADSEAREWSGFVALWWEKYADTWVSTGDLHRLAEKNELLGFVLGDKSERSQQTRLGKALGDLRDRIFGEHKIVSGVDNHTKAAKYCLIHAKAD